MNYARAFSKQGVTMEQGAVPLMRYVYPFTVNLYVFTTYI